MIDGYKGDLSSQWGVGAADTVAMPVPGIKSGDNLLHIVSMTSVHATPVGRDVSDFTVADDEITAGTIDLTGLIFHALWTSVADS